MNDTNRKYAISINGIKRYFQNPGNLIKFLEAEIRFWSWLAEAPEPYNQEVSQLGQMLLLGELNTAAFDAPVHMESDDIEVVASLSNYIESTSPEGKIAQELFDVYGCFAALFYLAHRNAMSRDIYTSGDYPRLKGSPDIGFERFVGMQVVVDQSDLHSLTEGSRIARLDILLKDGQNSLSRHLADMKERQAKVDDMVADAQKKIARRANYISGRLKRRATVYRKYVSMAVSTSRSSINQAADALKSANSTFESAKKAYHDQVDLEASVEYWSKRREEHAFYKGVWLIGVMLCMVLMFASVMGYYGFGGATGISALIKGQVAVQQVETIKKGVDNDAVGAAGQNSDIKQVDSDLKMSEVSGVVTDLVGAALLVALLSVLLKIALRQFNTHSFCALDAYERITFTKTYLALLNEGKLKSDEDRRLVLENLFRNSQLGGLAETSFSSPIELVLKVLESKKP
ncbi:MULTISPECIES: hypothetical protein [unclassified Pseudomonas]|uniref:hypothetical protein n=1 Tax=unclassified Pseudomonas TaxID=196821 RepID=UPI001AEB6659|nr:MULTISPECIES: hypothetical protein [unclassified Pseudomonas]MBP2273762.1 hypothetical protein [Pseudomonas sp. BP6]MBP2287267.1 hypothetical protein [Pseudomonas sp. BP7]HDS1696335.1 hypothetical protein [Pseudomonas putida]HDS1703380.1 hypothetical protein [Pseudomonas putida]